VNSPTPKSDAPIKSVSCTPNELYALEPEKVLTGVFNEHDYIWWGCYFNHVPEIDEYADYEDSDKLEVRIYKDFDFDGRRFWRLASIWYDGQPVMIIRNAGREGDDHVSRFVTDRARYIEMVAHILSLQKVKEDEINDEDFVDPDEEVTNLLEFYGNSLFGWFERYRH
jgi:hypothetical protein